MKKKAKTTTAAKGSKPDKTDKPFLDLLNAAMNEMKDRFIINKGKHDARASLLAPTLTAIRDCAAMNGKVMNSGVNLNATDCALLLDCLAEAGYVPAPPPNAITAAEPAMRIVRMPLAAPSPMDGCTDKDNPVAKAA